MSKIKVLFSDIGGVLLTNGWDHLSRKEACIRFNLDYEQLEARHNFIFNTYEIGKISLDDYLDTAVFYEEKNFSKQEFIDFMLSRSIQLPDTLDWMIDWKRKHPDIKVISINNEPRDLNWYRIHRFNLHRFFDAFISSCEVGMRKPEPGIFNLAVGIAQVKPEECLYIDDRKMLVKAAAQTGIYAFVHENLESTQKIFEKYFD